MSFLAVGLLAFAVATLTLFSGFGLGTLLLPAFLFVFPAAVAVAATGWRRIDFQARCGSQARLARISPRCRYRLRSAASSPALR